MFTKVTHAKIQYRYWTTKHLYESELATAKNKDPVITCLAQYYKRNYWTDPYLLEYGICKDLEYAAALSNMKLTRILKESKREVI